MKIADDSRNGVGILTVLMERNMKADASGNDERDSVAHVKQKFFAYKGQGKYEEALQLVDGFIQADQFDEELLYEAAKLCFMACDYEKTISYINDILLKLPNHIEACILLMRICMLGDQHTEALAIMELILDFCSEKLTAGQKLRLKEIVTYFTVTKEADAVLQGFPLVVEFLDLAAEKAIDKENELFLEHDDFIIQGKSAEEVKAEIMKRDISLPEKISLYNLAAGQYYHQKALAQAEYLLLTAFQLDQKNSSTVHNLALLMLDFDDVAAALYYAEQLSEPDVALLDTIHKKKQMCV